MVLSLSSPAESGPIAFSRIVPLCLDGLARESEVVTALDIASGVTAEGCPVSCDQNPDESTQN